MITLQQAREAYERTLSDDAWQEYCRAIRRDKAHQAWFRSNFSHPNEALRSRDPGQDTRAAELASLSPPTPRPGGLPASVGDPSRGDSFGPR